jgi:hypothetical protein
MEVVMVNKKYLEEILRNQTIKDSGHEERKGVLSMSSLHLEDDEIIRNYFDGMAVVPFQHLKFYRGKLAEEGFIERIVNSHIFSTVLVHQKISVYDDRLTGHTDILIPEHNIIFEYKSVPSIENLAELAQSKQVPYKVFCQVQGYLLWGKYTKAFIVYEAREGGYPIVIEMDSHYNKQVDLRNKAERILKQIDDISIGKRRDIENGKS